MSKHTPGPWYVKFPARFVCTTVSGVADMPVAAVGYWGEKEVEANARLIAAAPELLEILKDVRRKIENGYATSLDDTRKIDSVIAKAETPQ